MGLYETSPILTLSLRFDFTVTIEVDLYELGKAF